MNKVIWEGSDSTSMTLVRVVEVNGWLIAEKKIGVHAAGEPKRERVAPADEAHVVACGVYFSREDKG
jgi:hypothetical protein